MNENDDLVADVVTEWRNPMTFADLDGAITEALKRKQEENRRIEALQIERAKKWADVGAQVKQLLKAYEGAMTRLGKAGLSVNTQQDKCWQLLDSDGATEIVRVEVEWDVETADLTGYVVSDRSPDSRLTCAPSPGALEWELAKHFIASHSEHDLRMPIQREPEARGKKRLNFKSLLG